MPFFGTKKKVAMAQAGERKAQVDAGAAKHTKAATRKGAIVAGKKLPMVTTNMPTAMKVPTVISNAAVFSVASAIIRPHITEKSGLLSQGGVYTFVISTKANKDSVAKAIKTLYKVTPVKIALLNNPSKRVFVRGKRGTVTGIRKAVVTVKKGDKIDFV